MSALTSFNAALSTIMPHMTADVMMCVVSFLVYWILHSVKQRSVISKGSSKCIETTCQKEAEEEVEEAEAAEDDEDSLLCSEAVDTESVHATESEIQPSRIDIDQHVTTMRRHAAAGNIAATLATLRLLEQSGQEMTTSMHNIVLEAWIKCGNVWAAESWMEDEMKVAGLVDESSVIILIKAVLAVGDTEKSGTLLRSIVQEKKALKATCFDELLLCYARQRVYQDGMYLLQNAGDVLQSPSKSTLAAIAELVNSTRSIDLEGRYALQKLMSDSVFASSTMKYGIEMPCLLSAMSRADTATSLSCFDMVQASGSKLDLQAVRLAAPKKGVMLRDILESHCHDDAERLQMAAVLARVSKLCIRLPQHLEEAVLQFVGSDVYNLQLEFTTSDFVSRSKHIEALDTMSRCHPRVGFRHCWASSKTGRGDIAQRTLVNGEETDEASFQRHIRTLNVCR